jgi:hypothetical protein
MYPMFFLKTLNLVVWQKYVSLTTLWGLNTSIILRLQVIMISNLLLYVGSKVRTLRMMHKNTHN